MNSRLVKLPALNANDDNGELVKWTCDDRSPVKAGDVIAVIETTKATLDLEAPMAGYCAHLRTQGERIAVGEPVAVILERLDQNPSSFLVPEAAKKPVSERRWTKKAELTARKLGVDIALLADQLGRQVNESDVLDAKRPQIDVGDLVDDRYPRLRRERVLLIGGGGGGGVITLDAIARTTDQRAAGILDNNPDLHGKTLMGVPVLGANELAKQLWQERYFDAAIIVVTASVDERQRLFEELVSWGIPLTNVIDPSVQIRANVQMGTGNLIMPNGFLAACVTLGDNNFLASHVCIEHHSKVGSHCTLGPRTTTSGAVTIGDRVKFGMGVLVEPYLTIGDEALLPSGSIVTASVPARTVIKLQNTQVLRSR